MFALPHIAGRPPTPPPPPKETAADAWDAGNARKVARQRRREAEVRAKQRAVRRAREAKDPGWAAESAGPKGIVKEARRRTLTIMQQQFYEANRADSPIPPCHTTVRQRALATSPNRPAEQPHNVSEPPPHATETGTDLAGGEGGSQYNGPPPELRKLPPMGHSPSVEGRRARTPEATRSSTRLEPLQPRQRAQSAFAHPGAGWEHLGEASFARAGAGDSSTPDQPDARRASVVTGSIVSAGRGAEGEESEEEEEEHAGRRRISIVQLTPSRVTQPIDTTSSPRKQAEGALAGRVTSTSPQPHAVPAAGVGDGGGRGLSSEWDGTATRAHLGVQKPGSSLIPDTLDVAGRYTDAAMARATRRLAASAIGRGAEHDEDVAAALIVGHDHAAHYASRLGKRLEVSDERVQRAKQKLTDLVTETRAYIPQEFLFSERLKLYREKVAANVAVKVLGRFLHKTVGAAVLRWKEFTRYMRWVEADRAQRLIQRVWLGHCGRILARKHREAKEAAERRRQRRLDKVCSVHEPMQPAAS